MRKQLTTILLVSALVSLKAVATERKLSDSEKQKIAWALKILDKNKVIKPSQNQCLELDYDLLKQLESDGLLNDGTVTPQTVCFGGTI